jgi:hypothetical protein
MRWTWKEQELEVDFGCFRAMTALIPVEWLPVVH